MKHQSDLQSEQIVPNQLQSISMAEQAGSSRLYNRIILIIISVVILALALPFAIVNSHDADILILAAYMLFYKQDLIAVAILLLVFLFKPQMIRETYIDKRGAYFLRPVVLICLTLFLIILCRAGHHFVFFDRDLSRDEQMANFDADIFAHGQLFWVIPPFWRHFALALNQMYILPIGDHEAWVSAYLPINAAMIAAVGMFGDRALTSPLLVGVGFLALWRSSGRLWPDSPSARAVALLLYVGSSQVIFAGMTSFAMTGHLALNLLWLALFLEDRRSTHAGAAVVGFLATGLHQPLFHPLFALPFIGLVAVRRRWLLLAFYGISYALIAAFWFAWPIWISSHGVGSIPSHGMAGASFLTRLLNIIAAPDWDAFGLMALNLLRFATWQHLFLLPLLAFGLRTAWRGDQIARALAIGFLLPIPMALIVLPWQGNGWGYRYMHGVIGNACLLGGYGWRALETEGLSLHRAFRAASLATFLVMIPMHAILARRWVAPYYQVDKAIAASKADIVIIADDVAPIASDLALNRPDLSNRPIKLIARALDPSDMKALCAFGRVAFIDSVQLRPINEFILGKAVENTDHDIALEREAQRLNCAADPGPEDVSGR